MGNQIAGLRWMHEDHRPPGHGYKHTEEQWTACLGARGALQQHVHIRVKPVPAEHHSTSAAPPHLNCSRAPEKKGNSSSPRCHVSLACASDLLLTTHLSLSESWQLLRKTPGCSPVPGRMVTRQSFLGLRAGVRPADWEAFLILYSLFLFTLLVSPCQPLPSSLSFSFAL